MLSRCAKMVDRTVGRAKRHGMLKEGVDVSIEGHDPLHVKAMKLIYAAMSGHKKGTSAFARLAAIHCVSDGQSIRMAGLQRSRRICLLRRPARELRPAGRTKFKNALLLFC